MNNDIITATVEWLTILPNPGMDMTWEDHVMAGELPLQYRMEAKSTIGAVLYRIFIEDAGVWTPEENYINPIKGLMKDPPILRIRTVDPKNAVAIRAWKDKGSRYRALATRAWDDLLRKPVGATDLQGVQLAPEVIPMAACESKVDIHKLWTVNIPATHVRVPDVTPAPRDVTIHGLKMNLIDKDVRGFSVDWLAKPQLRYGMAPRSAHYA
jgi:hypothetical protein